MMDILLILGAYFTINIIIAALIWCFVPGKTQSSYRYFLLMALFGIPSLFLFVLIGSAAMAMKEVNSEKVNK